MFVLDAEPQEAQQLLATIQAHLPADVELGDPVAVFGDALVTAQRAMFSPKYAGVDDDRAVGVCRWQMLTGGAQELTVYEGGREVYRSGRVA